MVDVYLHCSDSGFGNAALIDSWHRAKGWSKIGYHYVVLNGWLSSKSYNGRYNGNIETGRPLDGDNIVDSTETGAHAYGFNKGTIAICLIGKSGKFTDEQYFSTLELLFSLEQQFGGIRIYQHSDVDPKKPYCAGINMVKFQENYILYKKSLVL